MNVTVFEYFGVLQLPLRIRECSSAEYVRLMYHHAEMVVMHHLGGELEHGSSDMVAAPAGRRHGPVRGGNDNGDGTNRAPTKFL